MRDGFGLVLWPRRTPFLRKHTRRVHDSWRRPHSLATTHIFSAKTYPSCPRLLAQPAEILFPATLRLALPEEAVRNRGAANAAQERRLPQSLTSSFYGCPSATRNVVVQRIVFRHLPHLRPASLAPCGATLAVATGLYSAPPLSGQLAQVAASSGVGLLALSRLLIFAAFLRVVARCPFSDKESCVRSVRVLSL